MKKIKLLIAFITISTLSLAQSKSVESFVQNAEGYNLFLYQSMIRVLNKDKNPDFNMLIKDLDHLRFVTHSRSRDEDGLDAYKKLDAGVSSEGFDLIFSVNNSDYKCNFYELETRKDKSLWVATLYVQGWAGLMEMKGSLNMKYLNALGSLNFEKLQEYLPMDDIKEDVEKVVVETEKEKQEAE